MLQGELYLYLYHLARAANENIRINTGNLATADISSHHAEGQTVHKISNLPSLAVQCHLTNSALC